MTMPDRRRAEQNQHHSRALRVVPPRRTTWMIIALLLLGTAAAVLAIIVQHTTPHSTGGSSIAGAPTGARIGHTGSLAVGDCAEIVPLPPDNVELFRADCDTATFTLDSVQSHCPARAKIVTRDNLAGWCFSWLVRAGDCVDTARNAKIACDTPVPDDGAHRTYLKILTVISGAVNGARCPEPHRYLRAGRGEHRGIACYEPTEPRTTVRATNTSGTTTRNAPHPQHFPITVHVPEGNSVILMRIPLTPTERRNTMGLVRTRTPQTVPDQAASLTRGSSDHSGPPAPWRTRTDAEWVMLSRAAHEAASSTTPASPRCSTEFPPPAGACRHGPHCQPDRGHPRLLSCDDGTENFVGVGP